jgi:hypothetical protein
MAVFGLYGLLRKARRQIEAAFPTLKQHQNVQRINLFLDSLRSIPAATRMVFTGRRRLWAVNIANRRKRVVFVAETPLRREGKFAYALKRAGWDVVLLHRRPPGFSDLSDFAEVQKYTSPWEAVELAAKAGAPIIHHLSQSFDATGVCLVDNKPARVIVDMYDIQYGAAANKPAAERSLSVDIAKQKYCLEKADAVCTADIQLQYWRKMKGVGRGKPTIFFPNYCWDRDVLPPRRSDGEVHIVQAGGMSVETEGFQDIGSFHVVRRLVEAGFHFDIYLHPFLYYGKETPQFAKSFADYLSLQSNTGRVHFHDSVPNNRLVAELSQYDFGFAMMNAPTFPDIAWTHYNPALMDYLLAGRFYDYLDAGLPILADGAQTFNKRFFRGAILDGTAFFRADRIAAIAEARPSRAKMLEIRQCLAISHNIGRLIRFYESLA